MFDVGVQGVAEGDHLNQRREQHEEERERIAQDDQEFFVEDGRKAPKGRFHCLLPLLLPAVSATKTSSREGAMGRMSACGMPALASWVRRKSSDVVLSTSRCMDW